MPTAPAGKMYVRIKPSNAKESHTAHGVTIRKTGGWYEVPVHTARLLAKERMNALNPDASPLIFDVKSKTEAEETVAQETVVTDPAGTLDRPRRATPTGPAASEPEADDEGEEAPAKPVKPKPAAQPRPAPAAKPAPTPPAKPPPPPGEVKTPVKDAGKEPGGS